MTNDRRSTLLRSAFDRLDASAAHQRRPFDCPELIRPNHGRRLFNVSHYGVMIPNLPEPFRFFSLMSIIGTAGNRLIDTDHMLVDEPRRNATQVSGTAAPGTGQFTSYSIDRDCELQTDGSTIRLGREITLSGRYPDIELRVTRDGFALSATLKCHDNVTWFAHLPFYKHLGLMADYQGYIEYRGDRVPISGICTYEYFTMAGPYGLRRRPLPEHFKIPMDFFSYQIVEIDADTQLMLAKVGIAGGIAMEAAFLRERGKPTITLSKETCFEVTQLEDQERVAPDGRSMRLPTTLTWVVRDQGTLIAKIEGTIDTPFLYGLTSGYVGGYRYKGTFRGRAVSGRAYIEYVDHRASSAVRNQLEVLSPSILFQCART